MSFFGADAPPPPLRDDDETSTQYDLGFLEEQAEEENPEHDSVVSPSSDEGLL